MTSDGQPPAIGPHTPPERVSAGQDAAVEAKLQAYADLLTASPHNLVSASDRDMVSTRHIRECRLLAEVIPDTGRWLDLGTGGGLPGIVVAICRPGTSWTLVDATAKKVAAVTEFVSTLAIDNAVATVGRAEELARLRAHRGQYSGVATRALAPLRVLVELARGFLGDGGILLAMKGPAWRTEHEAAQVALERTQIEVVTTTRLDVPDRESWVVTMRAHGPPPEDVPRPNGVPAKFPL